jgi:hypothetical protein
MSNFSSANVASGVVFGCAVLAVHCWQRAAAAGTMCNAETAAALTASGDGDDDDDEVSG